MAAQERKGVITFKGGPLTLVGAELKVGDTAPDFTLTGNDLSEVKLSDFKGKTVLISAVPSLDTPVCDMQTKRFNEEAGKLPANVVVLTVSADLPFAQARWCGATGSDKVKTASDYKTSDFAKAYGILIKELCLLTRAIFIVGEDSKIQYVEIVKEVTEQPNYDKALSALKAAV